MTRDEEQAGERTRLLKQNAKPNGRHQTQDEHDDDSSKPEEIEFDDDDDEDPKNWSRNWKYAQVLQLFIIGLVGPMASSIFAPAMDELASTFECDKKLVLAGQTGFVLMLGIGPLFLAPLSETIGRRTVFIYCLGIFTLLQIPVALISSVEAFIVLRILGGFFGSVGVANGGGSISDLYVADERAPVLGFYILSPLLGPTIGPFLGGVMLGTLGWRWIFWLMSIIGGVVTLVLYIFCYETNATTILSQRCKRLESENDDKKYKVKGESDDSVINKIKGNSTRAVKILCKQPIVLVMSIYQALIFSSMYSLYSNFDQIWTDPPYEFSTIQVACAYLAPAAGFIVCASIVVPYIDKIYHKLADEKNDGEGKPEYRLPLANVGAVFLPISMFWFGWTLEYDMEWYVPLAATFLFGASHVAIFNTCQNFYIDAFESMAASALAAGAFFRSFFGGLVPLFAPNMFEKLGYGWGFSVFGFLSVVLMPAPLLFFFYGEKLRNKFPLDI